MRAGAADRRLADLRAIHTARKQLALDDATYRGLIGQVAPGKSSSGDLSEAQRGRLLDTLRDLGFRRTRPKPTGRRATQADKIRALWDDMGTAGTLRDPSERALQAFVQRQTGKSRLEWCTPQELNLVIEGLKAWRARAIREQKHREE